MRTSPNISVILATRNRAESLRETLTALARQETHGAFTYEILVVDNGSTDHTRHLVEQCRANVPILLRYCYEGRSGRPWALNRGLEHAHGQFLAFTDDDVLPTPTWLTALWRCFHEEQADGVAGRVLPHWTAPRPDWLTDDVVKRIGGLGYLDYGPCRLSLLDHHRARWFGGNMAIRREVIRKIGVYDTRMVRAQDTEYCRRCVRHGLKVAYEPAALVYHKIGVEKMHPAYFRRWRHMTGHFHAYLLPWSAVHLFTIVPMSWYRDVFQLTTAWLKSVVARRPWNQRFWYELKLRELFSIWLHRLQLWPRWWVTVLTGRSWEPTQDSRSH